MIILYTYLYALAIKFDVIANKYATNNNVINKVIDQIFVILFKYILCTRAP